MTVKQLKEQIKNLGGKGYSSMNKAELEMYLGELTQFAEFDEEDEILLLAYGSQIDINPNDHIINDTKEEEQMTTTNAEVSNFKPMEAESSNKILNNNKGKEHKPVTDAQFRYYASLNRNYVFPDEIVSQTPTNLTAMSYLLDKMSSMANQGQVPKRSADEVKAMIEADREAGKLLQQKTKQNTDFPTQKQIAWLKDLASKLGRSVVIPRTKKEASDLIKALDEEYQRSLFKAAKVTEAVAVTSDTEPTEKKIGFFQYIINYFKRG